MDVAARRQPACHDSAFRLWPPRLSRPCWPGFGPARRAEEKKPYALQRRRHDRVRRLGVDVRQPNARHSEFASPNRRGALGAGEVLPNATKFRKVGLITYGPGPYNQCNVKLDLKPAPDAGKPIMGAVNALVPAGKTPLTSAVEQAAEVLNYRNKPGVIVVVTDGEETCGGSPCELAKQLQLRPRTAHGPRHRLPLRRLSRGPAGTA